MNTFVRQSVAAAALTAVIGSASAATIAPGGALTAVAVAGTASIYNVFGHPGNPGGDFGPDSSAVLITFGAGAGNVFSFSATGAISCCSNTPDIPPDGGTYAASGVLGANGLSDAYGNAAIPLVGVFTTETDPFGSAAPAALTFDAAAPTSLSPLLGQVFYIGDGKAGYNNAGGATLGFQAPTGATRLYLGVIDAYSYQGLTGYYSDNLGGFSVDVNLAPVPEPESLALLLAGLAVVGGMARRRRLP